MSTVSAMELFTAFLGRAFDPYYTIDDLITKSLSVVELQGHYQVEHGHIADQLKLTVGAWYRINNVISGIEPDREGWIPFAATLTLRSGQA